MANVAFVVARNYHDLIRDFDALDEAAVLRNAFERLGVDVSLHSFFDPNVDWARFDAVVPKYAWDYIFEPRRFVRWLDRLTAAGVRCVNDANLLKWNHDKSYLVDLQRAGVRVAPFVFVPEDSDPAELFPRLRSEGWDRAVIKPAVSGAAWKTHLTDLDDPAKIHSLASDVLQHSGLIAQPFFEEIKTTGEWSMLFINGEPTHAVLKTPQRDDFRSQTIWGGRNQTMRAPNWLLDTAAKALYSAPGLPTYGRVDGFIRDDQFYLMELELIEPYFFFENAPEQTADRFAQAVMSQVSSGRRQLAAAW